MSDFTTPGGASGSPPPPAGPPSRPPGPPSGWASPYPPPPPQYRAPRRRRRTGWVVAAVVGGLLFVGLLIAGAAMVMSDFFRLGDGLLWGVVEVGPDGDLSVFDLGEGECGIIQDEGSGPVVHEWPCDRPHDLEVYLVAVLEVEAPDGTLAIEDAARDLCEPAFSTYVGAAYSRSIYDYAAYVPDESRWNAGERGVACAVTPWEGDELVGSVAGTRR